MMSKICITDNDIFVSPVLRDIEMLRQHVFLNYTIYVQYLLFEYYLGHSGDSLGFIAASIDLPEAQTTNSTIIVALTNYR